MTDRSGPVLVTPEPYYTCEGCKHIGKIHEQLDLSFGKGEDIFDVELDGCTLKGEAFDPINDGDDITPPLVPAATEGDGRMSIERLIDHVRYLRELKAEKQLTAVGEARLEDSVQAMRAVLADFDAIKSKLYAHAICQDIDDLFDRLRAAVKGGVMRISDGQSVGVIPDELSIKMAKAIMEANGYVCLQKHTEPPKETGNYVLVYDSNYGREVNVGPKGFVMDCMKAIKSRGWKVFALGPIKGDG